MKSPMELLLGRSRADWRTRDRWILRVLVGFLGFFSFVFLFPILFLLHGYSQESCYEVSFTRWGFLCAIALLVLAERRIRSAPNPPD